LVRLYRRWIRRPYRRREYKYERFYLDLPGRFGKLLRGFLNRPLLLVEFVDKPLRIEIERVNSGLLIGITRNNKSKSSSSNGKHMKRENHSIYTREE